jgi:hypothetical protein
MEIAGEAEGGSAEFTRGWREIRDRIPEPGREWVELLESRFLALGAVSRIYVPSRPRS